MQATVQKKYMWECPSCKSRVFSEPVTLGVRDGQLTRIPPICDKCFKSCSCGQRQPYGEFCQVCGDPRKRVNLIRYEIDPDDPTFGLTSTGSTTYPETYTGLAGATGTGGSGDYEIAFLVTLAAAGTIIKVRLKTDGAINAKLALYDDDGGANEPATQLIDWGAFELASGLQTLTVSAYYATAGIYWIGYLADDIHLRYAVGTGVYRAKARTYSLGLESPWPNASDIHASGYDYYIQLGTVAIKGHIKLTKATLSEGAKLTSMSLYSHAEGNFKPGIYSDDSGPTDLLWEGGSTPAVDDDWKTVDIADGTPNTLSLDAGDYWLAWQWDSVNAGPSYTLGEANTGAYLAQAYGAFPDPMTGETLSTETWSLYVTYTQLVLSGVTRDGATGAIVGGCTVWLFKTSDKSYVGTTTSDPTTGAYSFTVVVGTAYFVRAFKDGTPNVFGTTDDDLVGA